MENQNLTSKEIRKLFKELPEKYRTDADIQPVTARGLWNDLRARDDDEDYSGLYVATHLPTINKMNTDAGAKGLGMGTHHVVSGRPGKGKTKMVMNMLAQKIIPNGHNVLWVNHDMSPSHLKRDYLAIRSDTNPDKLNHVHDEYDEEKLKNAVSMVKGDVGTLFLNHRVFRSMDDIRKAMSVYAAPPEDGGFGVKVFVFDTAQKMPGTHGEDYERVSRASEVISNGAHDLDVATILISQYTSDGARNPAKANMYKQRGGIAIVESADIFLSLKPGGTWKSMNGKRGASEILIEKNRTGVDGVKFLIEWDWNSLRCFEPKAHNSLQELVSSIKYQDNKDPDPQPENQPQLPY